MQKLWTKEEIKYLQNNYKNFKYKEIANYLGRTTKSIKHALAKYNLFKTIDGKTYIDNNDYFAVWTPNSAYISGYLMADGCINKNTLSCRCKEDDKEILEFIRNEISPVRPVRIYKNKCKKGVFPCAALGITNKQICKDLLYIHNICPNKTYNEKLPNIPEEFIGHYIRGLFDGDGCIHVKKWIKDKKYICTRKQWNIVSASESFLNSVNSTINNVGSVRRNPTCYGLYITSTNKIKYVYDLMYSNGGFCLERKYNKFLELGFESCH